MKSNIRKKSDGALAELLKTYELIREEVADRMVEVAGRIEEIDAEKLGRRAQGSARALRTRVESRVRPAPRRRMPAGLMVLGAATLGLAWLLYDRRRRDMIQGRITQLGVRTQEQVPGVRDGVTSAVDSVMGKVRRNQGALDETKLQADVEAAIKAGGQALPEGLQVAVEGRTVYLRGTVEAAVADQAAGRAQQVEGVAAVVNLTAAPQNGTGPRPAATGRS